MSALLPLGSSSANVALSCVENDCGVHASHGGNPADVFVGVLGNAPLSLETAFAGTVVAPNASLRMAPANKVFSGSLFAKQLLVEADTTVKYVPFAHWGAVLGLKPTLQCVSLFRAPYASALFGYVNETGSVLTLPAGASNGLVTLPAPAAGASPGQAPTTFQPGETKAAFWAPFQTSGVVSWTLGGTTVTASSATRACTSAEDLSLTGNLGPGTPLCRCDHVPVDQQLHCLQSLEEPNAAQVEGYAQYFAARAFNQDIDEGGAGCTFVYYKEFLDTACVPGAVCRPHPTVAGLFINDPPVPLPCAVAKRWRDTSCLGATPSTALLNTQTELDWLQFYYGIANAPVTSERWTSELLHDVYLVACGGGVPATARSCGASLVSWSGAATRPPGPPVNGVVPPPPTPASLVAGANGAFGVDSDLARSFRAKGRDFGVDDRTN